MTIPEPLEHPVLGRLVRVPDIGWLESEPVALPSLGGHRCKFAFTEAFHGPDAAQVDDAIRALLAAGPSLLEAARPSVEAYRHDMERLDPDAPTRGATDDLWSLVSFGDTILVYRRAHGDVEDGVYFSLECNCDWEAEHGLQLVVRDGTKITKVGAYDGHLTNADAFDDRSMIGAVYVSLVA